MGNVEKLDSRVERIVGTTIKTVGYVAVGLGVALEAKGLYNLDWGDAVQGLVVMCCGGGALGAAETYIENALENQNLYYDIMFTED